jgi:hypothetical protein
MRGYSVEVYFPRADFKSETKADFNDSLGAAREQRPY